VLNAPRKGIKLDKEKKGKKNSNSPEESPKTKTNNLFTCGSDMVLGWGGEGSAQMAAQRQIVHGTKIKRDLKKKRKGTGGGNDICAILKEGADEGLSVICV